MPIAFSNANFDHIAAMGEIAVVKISVRQLFTSISRTFSEHIKNAPSEAIAFPRVPIKKSTSPKTPNSWQTPRPYFPNTPTACASSTYNAASNSRFIFTISAISAISPSMLKTLSVTIYTLSYSPRFFSKICRKFAISLCLNRIHLALESLRQSTRLAWISLSQRIKSFEVAKAERIPELAWYPLLKARHFFFSGLCAE